MMEKRTSEIGFAVVLTIVFIVLKLCKVIEWSWVWVLSPLWISLVLAIVIVMVMVAIGKKRW